MQRSMGAINEQIEKTIRLLDRDVARPVRELIPAKTKRAS